MAKKLLNVKRSAKDFGFDKRTLVECKGASFKLSKQFVRIEKEDGTMRKPTKGEVVDVEREDTHVFVSLDIKDQKTVLCIEMAELNKCKGWNDVIVEEGQYISIKDSATVSVLVDETGVKFEFKA